MGRYIEEVSDRDSSSVTDLGMMGHPEEDTESKAYSIGEATGSHVSFARVGRENLADTLPPHDSYEGKHSWSPEATWTEAEERRVVRKTDLYLLSWLCVMVGTNLSFPGNHCLTSYDAVLCTTTGSWKPLKCNCRQLFD